MYNFSVDKVIDITVQSRTVVSGPRVQIQEA
jgi:hypothetical protein